MGKRLKTVLLAGLFAAWLCCPSRAAADSANTDASVLDDGIDGIPAADLEGWFLTFDPSNEWTSAANIATMESWLAVVEELGDAPDLLQQLIGLGMTDAQATATYQLLTSDSLTQQGLVPEPATLGLLGGALAILGLYTWKRVRRMNGRLDLCLATKD